MEYEITRNGVCKGEPLPQEARRRGLKRKLRDGHVGDVQLAFPTTVPCAPLQDQMYLNVVPHHPPNSQPINHVRDGPFMNNMDEISYWVFTKRAPCLMNYDNVFKKQNEECNFSKPKSIAEEVASPKKKKKRKLSLLDDDSVTTEKQKSVYFEASQQKQRNAMSCCKSGSGMSDIDFNIKNSSIQDKPKRIKLQKNSKTVLHKKNKVVTSTPKPPTVRRSLRKTQNNNYSQLNDSFEAFNASIANGHTRKITLKTDQKKPLNKSRKESERLANGDNNKTGEEQQRVATGHGQLEDLSDVSGFTANYIRSTKIQLTKTPRNLRSKGCRNLVKESRKSLKKGDDTILVCMNKSMNTSGITKSPILNCSTDSSQNIVNFVTVANNDRNVILNKSTSLLKFMNTKLHKNENSNTTNQQNDSNKQGIETDLFNSFESKNSPSPRYPRRHKNSSKLCFTTTESSANQINVDKKRRSNKNSNDLYSSDRKENPDELMVSRTRSGRSIGLRVRQPENSVLVVNNSAEPVTSVTLNVAVPSEEDSSRNNNKKKRTSCVKYVRRKKHSIDKSGQIQSKDSLRDKSGFAACFSDSEDDSEPLKQRKFFC